MSNLDLIDWPLVAFSALWILGLSVILAALSFADYQASQRQVRLRAVLRAPGYQTAINGGLVLFCLGLLGSARAWWEAVLWLGLAAAFGHQAWQAWPGGAIWNSRWKNLSQRQRAGIVLSAAIIGLALCLTLAVLALPDVLGLQAPRHCPVIAQNQDELRATGGFMTGVALVTVSRGRPVAFKLSDDNLVDDYAHAAYPSPSSRWSGIWGANCGCSGMPIGPQTSRKRPEP